MENQPTNQVDDKVIYRLHWISYLKLLPLVLIAIWCFAIIVAVLYNRGEIDYIALTGFIIFGLISLNSILNRLAYYVYMDNDGVWVHSGYLPWTKGYHGLNWRDISEAMYQTGFISWAFKSYKVAILHRYTKSSELILSNIKNGDRLVERINEKIRELNLY